MVEQSINWDKPLTFDDDETLLRGFAAIIGDRAITVDPHDMAPWCTDWRGRYHGRARAILSPATTSEVAALVTLARAHSATLVPQGGNTGTVGGATPSEAGTDYIVSLRRMNRIRHVDAVANSVVAEAGVILETLHNALLNNDRRFPLSLGAKGSATIGGLVSTNAGGTQVLRFGTMRSLVLGVEAVLPDGSVFEGLAALKKDNRGYDLTQLMIGAEGTLGIVTAASLRLVPAIRDSATAWVGVNSPAIALRLLRTMEASSGDAIESFEIIDAKSLDAVIAQIPGTRPPLTARHKWHILIDYVGECAATALEAMIMAGADTGWIEDAVIAANSAQSAAFWHIRESLSAAEKATGSATQHDLSVPVDAMPDFIALASAAVEARFSGTTAIAFGHLGDGNVHFHVRAPRDSDQATWRATHGDTITRFVHDLVIAGGGSISAEHGIGQSLRTELVRLSSPARLSALRAIKSALDPTGIMNPGKLVPLASDIVAA
ncbi:MAG: FAD-binding oxidoreductase [Sphingomonadaceae bacterium]